jgi:hypothetical protein
MFYRILTVIFAFPFFIHAQSPAATAPLTIKKLEGSIVLDGLSNEPGWQQIIPVYFSTLEPVYNAPPTEKTELLITYDHKYLYLAGRCYYKDSTTIVARNFVRDGWRGDDWFTVHIDANNDKQNAIVFSIYPFGSRYDLATANDAVELGSSTFNQNYNLIWEGKSAINKEGWFLEMKIPLSALRFKDRDGIATMNISSTRMIQYNSELQHFPMIPQNAIEGIMKPSLKQPVIFNDISTSKLLYIAPSLVTGITRTNVFNVTKGEYDIVTDKKLQPTLDVKYSLSPKLTLDLTANTDFAQAEADDQQFNLSRFSLFFPEKRLFFQEQAGLFEFNTGAASQLFYSRNIGLKNGTIIPIAGGARLTGKLGKADIGLLSIQTQSSTIQDSVRVPSENFLVLRSRHQVWNNNSYIGTMLTSRLYGGYHNVAGGVDAVIKVKGRHYLLGAFAASYDKHTKQVEGLNNTRFSIKWNLQKRDNFFYTLGYNYSGKNYNPGTGFVDRSNFHNITGIAWYAKFAKVNKETFQYRKAKFFNDIYFNASNGRLESVNSFLELAGTMFNQTILTATVDNNYEYLSDSLSFTDAIAVPPGSYWFQRVRLAYDAPVKLKLGLPVAIFTGTFYDGWRTGITLEPTWNISRYLELKASYNLDYLRFSKRNLESYIHVARLQLTWAANLHLSATVRVQYNSSIDKMLLNGRLRYNFSDGHDLFLVYNETFNHNRFETTPALPVFEQQQALVKYVYTFHK